MDWVFTLIGLFVTLVIAIFILGLNYNWFGFQVTNMKTGEVKKYGNLKDLG